MNVHTARKGLTLNDLVSLDKNRRGKDLKCIHFPVEIKGQFLLAKGQLNSESIFLGFKSLKRQIKFLKDFCPSL